MANLLDEMNPVVNPEGRDINVNLKQVKVEVGTGTYIFIVFLFLLGIIPGLIFLYMTIKAKQSLMQLEQKINVNASEIDNYMEQRVMILKNAVAIVDRAVKLDNETYTKIAAYRSGLTTQGNKDEIRNDVQQRLDQSFTGLAMAFENYPELRAHETIADAMKQNNYLQREITASRTLYNDSINEWNRTIFMWPVFQFVAARLQCTTRIPFAASKEIKQEARSVFF